MHYHVGMEQVYETRAKIWLYPGDNAWHFITIPEELSSVIKKKHGLSARGFGSLPVLVTVGKTAWKTSIFPDKRSGTYLLPIKAAVRKKEECQEGDTIALRFVVEV